MMTDAELCEKVEARVAARRRWQQHLHDCDACKYASNIPAGFHHRAVMAGYCELLYKASVETTADADAALMTWCAERPRGSLNGVPPPTEVRVAFASAALIGLLAGHEARVGEFQTLDKNYLAGVAVEIAEAMVLRLSSSGAEKKSG